MQKPSRYRRRTFWIDLCVFLVCGFSIGVVQADDKGTAASTELGESSRVAILDGAADGGIFSSMDGSKILMFGETDATIWDAKTFAEIGEPMHHGAGLTAARFDAAADRVLTVGHTEEKWVNIAGEVKLWDTKTGKLLLPPIHHGDKPLSDAAISHDGKLIATCFERDHLVRIWDAATGKQIAALDHKSDIWAVQFSPDGSTLVTSGPVNTLWNVRTWAVRMTLPGTLDKLSPEPTPAFCARWQTPGNRHG